VLLVRHNLRNVSQRKAFQKTLDPSSNQAFANRIQMAFDNDGWWGTDVEALRKVFLEIPNRKVLKNVGKEFKTLSRGDVLEEKLTAELTITQMNEFLAIVDAMPEDERTPSTFNAKAIAIRLNAAISETWLGFIPSTDDDAIKKAFLSIPDQAAFTKVAKAYFNEYAVKLAEDLNGDLWHAGDFDWAGYVQRLPKGNSTSF